MTAEHECTSALGNLAKGGLRFYNEIGSTNDEALLWASQGASDFSLVAADAQTSGRGRHGRKWYSLPGAGLAFSLILRPTPAEREYIGKFSGLGALALVHALQQRGLQAQIKWPNDVLIGGKKTAGILVEAAWMGDTPQALVLGMGVNITPAALPPAEQLLFPATCVQAELGHSLERFILLRDTLLALADLRTTLPTPGFIETWQQVLAFKDEEVHIWAGASPQPFTATLLGLQPDGSLRVKTQTGEVQSIHAGEVHLRPASTS